MSPNPVAGYPSMQVAGFTSDVAASDHRYSDIRSYPTHSEVPATPHASMVYGSFCGLELPPPPSPYNVPAPEQAHVPSINQHVAQSSFYNNTSSAQYPTMLAPRARVETQQIDASDRNFQFSPDMDYSWLFSNAGGGNGLFEEPFQFDGLAEIPVDNRSQYTDTSVESTGPSDTFRISPFTHATLLSKIPQELHVQPFFHASSLRDTLELAIDSLDTSSPIFHRPSFKADSLTMPLLLTLISYGFMTNIARPDLHSAGIQIHAVARRILYDADVQPSSVDLMFLQAMLVHEICGTFLGRRLEHEKSDVLHGQLVALARRSSFLVQDTMNFNGQPHHRMRTEERWLEWARRESTKRLAHFIFCNDVQQNILFNHTGLITVEDMKIAMPCERALWEASSSQWLTLQRQNQTYEKDCRIVHRDLVTAFIIGDRTLINSAKFDSLRLYLVMHGLLNMISLHAERKSSRVIFSHQSATTNTAYNAQEERLILNNALTSFERAMDSAIKIHVVNTEVIRDPFMTNTRVLLRLAKVGLQIYGPDMEVCAGAIFSGGRAVNPERVSQAWKRMTERHLSLESTFPALENIEDLCCKEVVSRSEAAGPSSPATYEIQTLGHEMIIPACIYNAALTIWTYSIVVQQEAGGAVNMYHGDYSPPAYQNHSEALSADREAVSALCRHFREHRVAQSTMEDLKKGVSKLMVLTSERMASSRSGIANEFRAVIMSLCK